MNLRLCHSYWSKPAQKSRWGVAEQVISNIWMAATSVSFSKKIGAKIVLHTDYDGKEALGWLPYDEIFLTLENSAFHPAFWASGKTLAQEVEPTGSIHIDLDVFIKRSNTICNTLLNECDLIVQSEEFGREIYHEHLKLVRNALTKSRNTELLSLLDLSRDTAYNCGVIGFNCKKLKHLFIKGYFDIYQSVILDNVCLERINSKNEELCFDLVAEQYWLKSIAFSEKAKVYSLLSQENEQRDAVEKHYTHIIGKAKYEDDIQGKVKELLMQIDMNLYQKCIEITKNYI